MGWLRRRALPQLVRRPTYSCPGQVEVVKVGAAFQALAPSWKSWNRHGDGTDAVPTVATWRSFVPLIQSGPGPAVF